MNAAVLVWVYAVLAAVVFFADSIRGERPSPTFWGLAALANLWIVAGRLS